MSKRSGAGNPLRSPNPIKHRLIDNAEDGIAVSVLGPAMSTPAATEAITLRLADESSPPRSQAVADAESPNAHGINVAVASPARSQSVAVLQTPASPGSNRAAFMQRFTPTRAVCNIDLCRAPAGTKVSISAVVIAVFPASANPDRRYLQLADETGSVGITVWNENVSKFSHASVGQVAQFAKIVMGAHQGKKVLTMTRESNIEFPDVHPLKQWWSELLSIPPVSLMMFQQLPENSIVNVAGVLGMLSEEVKIVHNVSKKLTTLTLTDPTGELSVKSWNHAYHDFQLYAESPILIKRVRVTSFNGVKLGELLGNTGSVIVEDFAGKAALEKYWIS
jgi:hypothetical protein